MPTSTRGRPPAAAPEVDQRQGLVDLYRVEREGMVRLAYLLTGSMTTAEDTVQEAFLKLHDVFAKVDRPGAYLRRTVVNLSHSSHRRRAVEDRWRHRQPPPGATLPPDLDETWRALQGLPDGQRAALVLRFYLDLKVDDVAAVLDLPVGTVKSHIHRGLAALTGEVSR